MKGLLGGLGVRQSNVDYTAYKGKVCRGEILSATLELSDMAGKAVVIGGLTVFPELLGYRQLRCASSDIDLVTDTEGVVNLVKKLKGYDMFYNEAHDDLFIDFKGFPCSVVTESIHDWKIEDDFFDSAVEIKYANNRITVNSPEYLIALKTRRSFCNGRVYGKDKIDIANILAASVFREDVDVDLEKTAGILWKHVSDELERINGCIAPISDSIVQFKLSERDVVKSTLDSLYRIVEDFYTKH